VYDSMTGKNISLEMGSYRTGLIESAERSYIELIGEKEAKLVQTIQVAANGKNRVFRGVTEPVTGMVKNDIWYQPVGAGETMMYVFDGAYWQLNKVSAGLLGGTLDAENGDVNLINVNVANIVGETSNFVKSWWNNAAGGGVDIDGNGIVTQSGELLTRISAGKVTNQSGTKSGKVDALGMEISDSNNGQTTKLFADGLEFGWYSIIRQITQTSEGLQIKPITGSGFRLNSALNLTAGPGADKVSYLQLDVPGALSSARVQLANKTMSLRHPNGGDLIVSNYDFDARLGVIKAGTFRTATYDGRGLNMVETQISTASENQTIFLIPSGTGELRVGGGGGNPTLWPIRASRFVEGSNRETKTNIKAYEGNALDVLNGLNVVTFNRKEDLARGFEYESIGFIAEDSPSISIAQPDAPLGVDHYKMVSLAIKGIQEIDEKLKKIEARLG
jgi:hypothetical protein